MTELQRICRALAMHAALTRPLGGPGEEYDADRDAGIYLVSIEDYASYSDYDAAVGRAREIKRCQKLTLSNEP